MPNFEHLESIPDPSRTMGGLRDTGYTFVTAVADLIDNSIAAEAKKVDILVQMGYRGSIDLRIADDGCGMDREALIRAMKYGSPQRPDPASLGKYGLGLKTASTAFCRSLSVLSRPSRDVEATMATWDLDYVAQQNGWFLQLPEIPDPTPLRHLDTIAKNGAGTVVWWRKVDRLIKEYQRPTGRFAKKALEKHCDELKDHIAITYQRFLDEADNRARNVKISVNGVSVHPWDPFQKQYSELVATDNRRVSRSTDDGSESELGKFQVNAYVLPRRDEFPSAEARKAAKLSSDMQGLYIYREQRLIHMTGWLKMWQKEPHCTLLRVEFSFDHLLDEAFQLDIKKSQITLNDRLWKWLKTQFLSAPRRVAITRYRKGRQKDVANEASSAHRASNNSIRDKEAEVGGAEVIVNDPKRGEVTVTNSRGSARINLKISEANKPNEVCVQPADDVEDGCLFEPTMIEGHKAVRINTSHPYYHKVYVPNIRESVTVQGMDSLLWALCVAELSVTTAKMRETFDDMRYEVSRILRKLVKGLPEPKVGTDDD